MKRCYYILLFLLCTSGCALLISHKYKHYTIPKQAKGITFTPENTQIQFDIDETIIHKSRSKLYMDIIETVDYNFKLLFPLFFGKYASTKYRGCRIGHPWDLLRVAIKNKKWRKYVKPFMQEVAASHKFVPGAIPLIKRLKEKDYSIAYATNKDRISYDYAAHYLGEPFTSFPDKVIVFYPDKNDLSMQAFKEFIDNPKVPESSFKELIKDVYNISETDKILHSPETKPSPKYAARQREIAGDKYIIFFDDLLKNVAIQKHDNKMIAIKVDVHTLDIAEPLVDLGILNPEKDKKDRELINQLYKNHPRGKMKKWWKSFKEIFTPPKRSCKSCRIH